MKKYELTGEVKRLFGRTLYQIRALINIEVIGVEAGDLGGFIEKESNLSQEGNAWVCGNAKVYGDAEVCGNAKVYGNADYITFKNWWSSGRWFTWTRSNNKWKVGCFFGTGAELIAKAYKDSEKCGREYERVVKYVQSILEDENNE